MARPLRINKNDVDWVYKEIEEFKKDPTPTISGLMRRLGIARMATLHKYLNEYSDRPDLKKICDLIIDAYLFLVEQHEKGLWNDKRSLIGHIFWLKTVRQLGFRFSDQNDYPKEEESKSDNNLIIDILEPSLNAN